MRITKTAMICGMMGLVIAGVASGASLMRIASGLNRAVLATHAPGDKERLFIVEQRLGEILIYDFATQSLLPEPFLDIDSLVINSGSERGLLGLAFHPDYQDNGYFFVNFSNNSGRTIVARYSVSTSNPDSADANSKLELMSIPQPYTNHNGGGMEFSPLDGFLYIGMGDGGDGNDPENRAQSDTTLHGKFLRIDVDNPDPGLNYGIPESNPYHGMTTPRPEIWSKGWRNPWRWAFDEDGDLYVADVGQGGYEEIDFQPAASVGGENYGWRCREGMHCTNNSCELACPNPAFTDPIYEYERGGDPFRCSVTGGRVYRGCALPEFEGKFFYADYCSDQIWSIEYDGNSVSNFTEHTADFTPDAGSVDDISSFGVDGYGELYICCLNGNLYRIIPDGFVDDNSNGVHDPCECTADDVTRLTALRVGNDLWLRWLPDDDPLVTYRVYRTNDGDAEFPGVEWTVLATDVTERTYTDANPFAEGDLFFYVVVAECPE